MLINKILKVFNSGSMKIKGNHIQKNIFGIFKMKFSEKEPYINRIPTNTRGFLPGFCNGIFKINNIEPVAAPFSNPFFLFIRDVDLIFITECFIYFADTGQLSITQIVGK